MTKRVLIALISTDFLARIKGGVSEKGKGRKDGESALKRPSLARPFVVNYLCF